MIVPPTHVNISPIIPSANVQTEQVARDNKIRDSVAAPAELVKSHAERALTADDKRRKRAAWEASEHPDYELNEESGGSSGYSEEPEDALSQLFELLALQTYSQGDGSGYTIRFRLPKKLLDAVIAQDQMKRRRVVIKYHYGHSVAPNNPSEVIAVL